MKKFVLAIASIAMMLAGTNVFAQGKFGADSAECVKYLSYYKEYFKQKNYNEAMPLWRKAYQFCPPASMQSMLVDGTTLVRFFIAKNGKDAAYQKALVDTLMTLHNLRIENFPKYAVVTRNNKGLDVNNYLRGDSARQYEEYEEIIKANGNDTKSTILLFDLNSAIELYQAGKLTAEDIINIYQRNSDLIDKVTAKTEADIAQNANVKTSLENMFIQSNVASCDNLLALFTPRYEANPNDLDLATNIVKMLNSAPDGCTDNDLYLKAATTMYKLNPSSAAAYSLFRLNASKGNAADAVRYMDEAIASSESDSKTDSNYNIELAAFCLKSGMSGKAFDAAKKAADLNPENAGKAYMIIASIWGSVSCGGNEIEKRAPYWVAVDYLQKAKAADASLTEKANELIGQYSRYYPQTAEAFMYDITDGQSYNVSCGGMHAVTTVRTQK